MEPDQPDPSPDPARAAINQMYFWLDRSRWEEGIKAGRAALAFDPDSPEIHRHLGWALTKLDRDQEAEEHLRKSLQGAPEDSWTLSQLSLVLLSQQKLSVADREAVHALRQDPDDTSAWYALGASALNDDTAFARQCAAEIRKRNPTARGHFHLRARAAIIDETPYCGDIARAEYEEALTHHPDCAWLHYHLGYVYLGELQDDRKAEQHLKSAAAIDPSDLDTQEGLAQIRIERDLVLRVLTIPWRIHNKIWDGLFALSDKSYAFLLGIPMMVIALLLAMFTILWLIVMAPVLKCYEWLLLRADHFGVRWLGSPLGRFFQTPAPLRAITWLALATGYLALCSYLFHSFQEGQVGNLLTGLAVIGVLGCAGWGWSIEIREKRNKKRRRKLMSEFQR